MLINNNAAESNGGEKELGEKKRSALKETLRRHLPFLMGVDWESTGNPETEAKLEILSDSALTWQAVVLHSPHLFGGSHLPLLWLAIIILVEQY